MEKKGNNETAILDEEWDLDASASDNESYDIEMMQNQTLKISTGKEDSEEKAK